MKRNRKLSIGLSSLLLLALILVNCIIIFSKDSKITRSYYITDYERVALEQQRAYLEKEAMIVPQEEIRITADASALAQVSVRPGQKISMDEEIASYKTEEAAQEQSKLQSEVNAYERELTTLEGILRRLEAQDIDDPLTTIDSEQIGEDLTVTVETEVIQGTPVEAIASIEKQIAEVERNIEILSERISELSFSNVLSSPSDGVIGEVIEDNGTISFIIYTDEKELITYVSEREWEQVAENQTVELNQSLIEKDVESESVTTSADISSPEVDEDELLGIVVEKQTIPATSSLWYNEMEKVIAMPKPLSFEVRINVEEAISYKPYASLTNAKIIIDEASNAIRVDNDWVISKEVASGTETVEKDYIYSLDEDGKIQTTEVNIAFKDKGESILTSNLPNDQIIFHDQVKNELSSAFLPMPFEIPSKAVLQELDWKQYAKYIIF